jgi:hypothetical protein
MWANMLRAFQVGKALTSDGWPSSWMRPSLVAWAQVRWPAWRLSGTGRCRTRSPSIVCGGPPRTSATGDTAWTRRFFAALGPFREGVYVNFLGGDEEPDRVREAYGDSVYERLVGVKTKYDPGNVFHHNQNIRRG